jgi:hypothetical protein
MKAGGFTERFRYDEPVFVVIFCFDPKEFHAFPPIPTFRRQGEEGECT